MKLTARLSNGEDAVELMVQHHAHPLSLPADILKKLNLSQLSEAWVRVVCPARPGGYRKMWNTKVHECGGVVLSREERGLLAHGFGFVPTPRVTTKYEWRESVSRFIRTLKLRYIFDVMRPSSGGGKTPFYHIRTEYDPDKDIHGNIRKVFDEGCERLLKAFPRRPKKMTFNLPRLYRQALAGLNGNKKIVVTLTDKNMGVMALPTAKAKEATNAHLLDEKVFAGEKGVKIPFNTLRDGLAKLAEDVFADTFFFQDGNASSLDLRAINGVKKFLRSGGDKGDAGIFYGLPKPHKLTKEQMDAGLVPPVRPIGQAHRMITTPAAILTDRLLQGAMRASPAFIPDSIELIKILGGLRLPREGMLFAADITAMYPNVATDDEAVKRVVQRVSVSGGAPSRVISADGLSRLIKFCLNNHWVRGPSGRVQQQKSGLGTGSPFAPPYSVIWWATYEDAVVADAKAKGNLLLYKRFIDDIFGVWKGDRESLDAFLGQLSSLYSTIKLEGIQVATRGSEVDHVNFLDLTIGWEERGTTEATESFEVRIRTHQKPLNVYQYLPRHTFHPPWVVLGWVRGEVERYARTCTRKEDFDAMLTVFRDRLAARGYAEGEVNKIFRMVDHGRRSELLEVVRKPAPYGDPVLDAHRRPLGAEPDPLVLVARWSPNWVADTEARHRVKSIMKEMVNAIFPEGKRVREMIAFKNSPVLRVRLKQASSLSK